MVVVPCAITAVMMIFAVPVTDASSRSIYDPDSPLGAVMLYALEVVRYSN